MSSVRTMRLVGTMHTENNERQDSIGNRVYS